MISNFNAILDKKKQNDYNNTGNLEIKARKEVVENRQACQVETKEVSRKF